MNLCRVLLLVVLMSPLSGFSQENANDAGLNDPQKLIQWAENIWNSLDRRTGKVQLPGGIADLKVPEGFYYLGSSDASRILVDVWKNPPGDKVLGMLFPEQYTPFDSNVWAITLQYREDGYVSDQDIALIDFSALLVDMKKSAREDSRQRQSQGFETITLLAWAKQPDYDKQSHKLYWGRELKFGSQQDNTLHYSVNVLGRKGVLALDFVAARTQKQFIEQHFDNVLRMVEFKQGYRYEEFDPSVDKLAGYGIRKLIAGELLQSSGSFSSNAVEFMKTYSVFFLIAVGVLLGLFFQRF